MTTWLITGCSTGLGRALAQAVLDHGDNCVVTARDEKAIADIVGSHPDTALGLALDVTDDAQVASVVGAAKERFGGVDVLVNNAGYGYRAAVEEGDFDDIRRLFETHVFGSVRMMQAVLPGMRERRSGTIVNISSIGARISPDGSGYYAAVKAALEAMTLSLRNEAKHLGIRAIAVEPGGFRTDFAGRSLQQSAEAIDDYAETAGKRRKENDTVHGRQAGDPAQAARALIEVVGSDDPPYMLILGNDASDAFRSALQSLLDDADAWESLSRSTDFDA